MMHTAWTLTITLLQLTPIAAAGCRSRHVSVPLLPLSPDFPVKPPTHPPLWRSRSHPDPQAIRILMTPQRAAQAPPFQSLSGAAANHHQEAWPTFSNVGQGRSAHLWPTWAGDVKFIKYFHWKSHNYSESCFTFCGTTSCASAKQKTGSRWKDCNRFGPLSLPPLAVTANGRHSARALFYDTRESSTSPFDN